MRKILLILILLPGLVPAFGQQGATGGNYRIGAQYTHEFVLDGYVRVREWEFTGDRMKLRDLGMRHYPAVRLYAERRLSKDRSLTLSYDHYYMHGHSTFDRDITYNGTIIDGRQGIDVSSTRYHRLSLAYRGTLLKSSSGVVGYMAGLVADHITFYLDGEVSPASTKNEVYEGFGRQVFPYPMLGLNGRTKAGKAGHLNLDVSGTYVPEFKSFYTEGGPVYLQYSLAQADLSYSREFARVGVVFGARTRYMHLFQESAEDTNILNTLTGGPYIGFSYGL